MLSIIDSDYYIDNLSCMINIDDNYDCQEIALIFATNNRNINMIDYIISSHSDPKKIITGIINIFLKNQIYESAQFLINNYCEYVDIFKTYKHTLDIITYFFCDTGMHEYIINKFQQDVINNFEKVLIIACENNNKKATKYLINMNIDFDHEKIINIALKSGKYIFTYFLEYYGVDYIVDFVCDENFTNVKNCLYYENENTLNFLQQIINSGNISLENHYLYSLLSPVMKSLDMFLLYFDMYTTHCPQLLCQICTQPFYDKIIRYGDCDVIAYIFETYGIYQFDVISPLYLIHEYTKLELVIENYSDTIDFTKHNFKFLKFIIRDRFIILMKLVNKFPYIFTQELITNFYNNLESSYEKKRLLIEFNFL